MSLKTRFIAVLGLILVLFLGSIYWQREIGRRTTAEFLQTTQREREALLERLLALLGASLRTFATDYSLWDEMVAFAQNPTPEWAAVNIDASLPNFNAVGAWVFQADGRQVYATSTLPGADAEFARLFTPRDILAITRSSSLPHFFVEISSGLLEIRGSPLQPSSDTLRQTPPLGWFFVARRWDDKIVQSIAHLNESEVRITRPDTPPDFADDRMSLRLQHVLRDAAGEPLRILHLRYRFVKLERLLSIGAYDILPFVGYGTITIGIVVLALLHWVLRPLHFISRSLAEEEPRAIQPLLSRSDEMGRVARLVQTAAEQRSALQTMLAERARLGRDLHDSVIQTIYACGMGVMTARLTLRSDPATSERTLEQVSTQFNEIIHDLRGFIMGLEPEMLRHRTFPQALHAVVENFRTAQHAAVNLQLDATLEGALDQQQQVHVLHIVRESLSNAIRHGGATVITVALRRENGNAVVEITDNGRGFDTAADSQNRGKGLVNLNERTKELAGSLSIESSPGQPTRIRVTIPLLSPSP